MLKLGSGTCVSKEKLRIPCIHVPLAGYLHGDVALKLRVTRFPDTSKSSGSDFVQEYESAEHLKARTVGMRGLSLGEVKIATTGGTGKIGPR
jgi:hypothetical protein